MSTGIQWCDETWNVVTGCTPISEGCDHCWARRMAQRLKGRCGYPADDPFKVTFHRDRIDQPLRWKKPRRIFVSSMGDLFHEDVPADYITTVYDVMAAARAHTFIVLTKRPYRLEPVLYGAEGKFYLGGGDYVPNIWHLTSVENRDEMMSRVPALLKLRECPLAWPVLGVSCEPLLDYIALSPYLAGLDWVIVGCESGPGRRECKLEWVCDIVKECQSSGVPVFVKQLSINGKVSHNPAEWPEDLRVRQFPKEG